MDKKKCNVSREIKPWKYQRTNQNLCNRNEECLCLSLKLTGHGQMKKQWAWRFVNSNFLYVNAEEGEWKKWNQIFYDCGLIISDKTYA
jgi:hypothetical protein